MIDDLLKAGIIEAALKKPLTIRMRCSYTNNPIVAEDVPTESDGFFYTNGLYGVKFLPFKSSNRARFRPYLIRADIFYKGTHRVASWKDLLWQCDSHNGVEAHWQMDWLVKNTNISERLFEIARANFNLYIPFCLDAAKYCDSIKSERFRSAYDDPFEVKRMLEREKTKMIHANGGIK